MQTIIKQIIPLIGIIFFPYFENKITGLNLDLNHKYKQVIILRTDIKMSTGKKVAQGCHAAVIAVNSASKYTPAVVQAWVNEGQRKIALKVVSEEELLDVYQRAKFLNLPCSLVQDAGLTQLEPGTKTAVGIGPAKTEKVDSIVKTLKLL